MEEEGFKDEGKYSGKMYKAKNNLCRSQDSVTNQVIFGISFIKKDLFHGDLCLYPYLILISIVYASTNHNFI